ncbi:uncharacterized protein LOC111064100 [Nilaparvata lugens]|uniref:uncharacterized protein LOC111064100 n=1 Tax=Nilaparvata lugens TaxID=108931 RepID=UPI000B98CF25|nr:uncharacterized protein LOC111064100 [Nilaparvata lugens]
MADFRTATATHPGETAAMAAESWLLEVKRMRIPRPKFQTRCPAEPPKDYYMTEEEAKAKRDLAKATEELRRAVQDKL